MRLVLFVRKLDSNDSRMSFFSEWIKVFAKYAVHIDVITWQESNDADVPTNATLHILRGGSFKKVLNLQKILAKVLLKADALYCHMNPEYTIASFPMALMLRVPITHWYAHGAVNTRRKLMEVFATNIVTSSAKGFRNPLFPKKVHSVGQGIDTSLFAFKPKTDVTEKHLIYVGRISPVKDLESVIKAVDILKDRHLIFDIYGEPAMKQDMIYLKNLKQMVSTMGLEHTVTFKGGVPYRKLPGVFQNANAFVNMSTTGSLDKTVLEALSTGCAVLTANDAYSETLANEYMVEKDNPELLAKKLGQFFSIDEKRRLRDAKRYRAVVEERHSLPRLVNEIFKLF